MGENQVGVPGCDVVGSAAVEIFGAHAGISIGGGDSTVVAAGCAGWDGMAGAHVGRTGVPGCDGFNGCGGAAVTGTGMGPLGGPESITGAGEGCIDGGIGSGTVEGPGVSVATGPDSASNDSDGGSVSPSDSTTRGMLGGVLIVGGALFATGSEATAGAAGS